MKYDEKRVEEAQAVMQRMLDHLDDCRDMTEKGVRSIDCFHVRQAPSSRVEPSLLEGFDHLFFYALEKHTGNTSFTAIQSP